MSVVNTATGAVRDVSGADGRRPSPALSLTGTYTVSVSKAGFTAEDVNGPHAARRRDRDGEGHAGRERRQDRGHRLRHRRRACARTRRSAAGSTARRIDETPILGRKVTTLPLLNSAFRQGKGTGDLFVNATYFVTGARQPPHDDVHARRREQRRGLGPPDDDRHRAARRHPGNDGALERVFGRVRLDRRPGVEHRHQVRHERRCTAKGCIMGRPGGMQAKTFSTDGLLPAVGAELRDADHAHGDQPGGHSGRAEPGLRLDRRRRSSRTRRSSSPRPTTRGRIGRRSSRARCRRSCCRRTAT